MNISSRIVDRECPVHYRDSDVIATLYRKMRPEAKRAGSRHIRRRAYRDALAAHHRNQQECADVLAGQP